METKNIKDRRLAKRRRGFSKKPRWFLSPVWNQSCAGLTSLWAPHAGLRPALRTGHLVISPRRHFVLLCAVVLATREKLLITASVCGPDDPRRDIRLTRIARNV